ncbi:TrmH family RNA methyltransferase [Mesonia aestuariivivens]|uniref:TrmH family RNA methyltransferase n=1 Tax=Mesonia aestuariivivens TaxID=2796128 RepID=A0ABS6VYY0_9FLAO|nr:TrmH family RNA methyltransferase [Mesonia aestuariivivens]MBW2960807.1 TrmH family RNA methyltransferase [Mesonia aestuariivivens]
MSEQLDHYSNKFSSEKFPIILITADVSSPANLGSLFRLADAFHIEKIIFCGIDEHIIDSNRLKRTARSTQQHVLYEFKEDIYQIIDQLSAEGIQLLALEITDDSVAIANLPLEKNQRLALIIGEENIGVPSGVLERTSKIIHIPMFGKNSSMNVAQATGIALYEITKKLSSFQ